MLTIKDGNPTVLSFDTLNLKSTPFNVKSSFVTVSFPFSI